MFRFRRKSNPRRVDGWQAQMRITGSQLDPMSRLPDDVRLGPMPGPSPEYIGETAAPTEDVWAREQARYQEKNGPQPD